jgi:protein TonB
LQPDDSNAMDALRELFPFATGSAEDQINQGNFEEASRIMGLLAKADPSNYALTILRSKLDARRRLAEREQAQQAQKEALAAAQAAAGANPQARAATPATPSEEAPAPDPTPAAAPARAQVAAATPAPAAAPPPAPAAPVGETRDARVVVPPSPNYPVAAVRNRQNGWVEVEFVVTADGSVRNARVTASDPRGVFDREALSAVQKAKFEPRLQNGQPLDSTLRRRIEFKLN